jgi:mannosyl-3-phosphoglycerate synthase
MRIETQRYTERFGSVRLNEVQKVLELDSGKAQDADAPKDTAVLKFDEETLRGYENKMAIAIPVKNEKLKLFEGVISGVPHDCLLIVVSNSQRGHIDRFRMEKDALTQYCHFTRRPAYIVHQKDPVLAKAMSEAGYTELLGADGLLKDGKCEGMIAATLLATMLKKNYIGFIDADNYFPGSVLEYVKCYAAGFSLANSPYCIVRILWHYKPKVSAGMFFRKLGRVSEVSNKYLNSLISYNTGFETEIIRTANAGEHAMSLQLAQLLTYAAGYAVETQELLSIFEGFGGVFPLTRTKGLKSGVEIFQIETRNPHLHEERGKQHLEEHMLLPSLGAIYHSQLCDEDTREKIKSELISLGILKNRKQEPPTPVIYRSPSEINIEKFGTVITENLETFTALTPV